MNNKLLEYNNDNRFTEEEEELFRKRIFVIILIVLVMVLAVLTLGWFYKKQKEEQAKEKALKEKRLAEVEILIKELQAHKEKIEKKERKILLWSRIGIGVIFLLINYMYKYYMVFQFDFENDIGKFLNLNAAILSAYSFLAYISYGTVSNFVKRLKEILAQALRKKHIHSLEELESLLKEKERLQIELNELK